MGGTDEEQMLENEDKETPEMDEEIEDFDVDWFFFFSFFFLFYFY